MIWLQWHTVRQRQWLPCPSARYFLACSTILRHRRPPSTRAYFLECSTILHHLRPPSRQAGSTIDKYLRIPSTFLNPCSTRQSGQLSAVTGPGLKFPLLHWHAKTWISSRTWSIRRGLSQQTLLWPSPTPWVIYLLRLALFYNCFSNAPHSLPQTLIFPRVAFKTSRFIC